MAKEIQRTLEYSNVLKPDDPSPDNMIALQIDISEFFFSFNWQVLFDMLAGKASCAYPHTNLQPGDPMPTHPVFSTMLPIAVALARQKALLPCYHKSRKVAHITFTTGFSQGDTPGPRFSSLVLHFGIHVTLQQFPDLDVKGYGIMDDVTILGIASHLGPIYARMQLILKDCLHLDINLTKSSLIALQLYTIVSPDCDLTPLYQECPDLRSLPVKTEQFVCVGVPIGYLSFLNMYMQHMIGELSMEFQKLISYPHQHDFLLMLRYCCNQKSSIWN